MNKKDIYCISITMFVVSILLLAGFHQQIESLHLSKEPKFSPRYLNNDSHQQIESLHLSKEPKFSPRYLNNDSSLESYRLQKDIVNSYSDIIYLNYSQEIEVLLDGSANVKLSIRIPPSILNQRYIDTFNLSKTKSTFALSEKTQGQKYLTGLKKEQWYRLGLPIYSYDTSIIRLDDSGNVFFDLEFRTKMPFTNHDDGLLNVSLGLPETYLDKVIKYESNDIFFRILFLNSIPDKQLILQNWDVTFLLPENATLHNKQILKNSHRLCDYGENCYSESFFSKITDSSFMYHRQMCISEDCEMNQVCFENYTCQYFQYSQENFRSDSINCFTRSVYLDECDEYVNWSESFPISKTGSDQVDAADIDYEYVITFGVGVLISDCKTVVTLSIDIEANVSAVGVNSGSFDTDCCHLIDPIHRLLKKFTWWILEISIPLDAWPKYRINGSIEEDAEVGMTYLFHADLNAGLAYTYDWPFSFEFTPIFEFHNNSKLLFTMIENGEATICSSTSLDILAGRGFLNPLFPLVGPDEIKFGFDVIPEIYMMGHFKSLDEGISYDCELGMDFNYGICFVLCKYWDSPWENHILKTWHHHPPKAIFTYSPIHPLINERIFFDASNSYDPDGEIIGYRWDFENDGNYDTTWLSNPTITHVYNTSGNYTITLQVLDNSNATDTDTAIVSISSVSEKPIADAGGPYYGLAGHEIFVNASASYDVDGEVTGYRWDFENDGNYDTTWLSTPTTTFIYTKPGTYVIKLEVKDNGGATDTDTAIANIYQPGNCPPVPILGDVYYGMVHKSISFDASRSFDLDGKIIGYRWDFNNDGHWNTIWLTSPFETHVYFSEGVYSAKLMIMDNDGLTNTTTTLVKVSEPINTPPSKPELPYPWNCSNDVCLNPTLSWQSSTDPDDDPISYDVYFGTSPNPSKASDGQVSTLFTPNSLTDNTKYYWYIVAKDNHDNEVKSGLWEFTTENKLSEIMVGEITGGANGVNVELRNIGETYTSNIEWSMKFEPIDGGEILQPSNHFVWGMIRRPPTNHCTNISSGQLQGYGYFDITIIADDQTKTALGFVVLGYVSIIDNEI